MSVSAPSTTPGMSEVLRNIFLKRVTLKGHQDYFPTLIPGQRPALLRRVPSTLSPSRTLPCQLISL